MYSQPTWGTTAILHTAPAILHATPAILNVSPAILDQYNLPKVRETTRIPLGKVSGHSGSDFGKSWKNRQKPPR